MTISTTPVEITQEQKAALVAELHVSANHLQNSSEKLIAKCESWGPAITVGEYFVYGAAAVAVGAAIYRACK